MKSRVDIAQLFSDARNNDSYLKVCAPMVRYSKVQFRTLVKNYGVDLCFTPMILADSFCQNKNARYSEFSTTVNDNPLIVQFAANNVNDFVDATRLVYPYADGVDLNCGCPQRWAMKDGYGCAMLSKPELIQSLVKSVKNSLPSTFSVSVKLRLLQDLKKTLDICQKLEKCGVDFLTIHGRVPEQKSCGAVDRKGLKLMCQSLQIPVIANGGVKSLVEANELQDEIKCNGVMVASAILTNPALFSGINRTPTSCVSLWKNLKDQDLNKLTFQCYHHHLVFMLDKILTKQQKTVFNNLNTFEMVDDYLEKYILQEANAVSVKHELGKFISCEFNEEITMKHCVKCRSCGKSKYYCICNGHYDCNTSEGSFFTSYLKEYEDIDYMDSNLFNEIC